MGMTDFNKDVSVPGFGLVRMNNRSLGALYQSPRVNGVLVPRQNDLPMQIDQYGVFDRVSLYVGDTNSRNFTTRDYLHTELQNRGLRFPNHDTKIRNEAIIKCYGKIYEKVANVADIIRTRTETVNMVVNTVRDLRRSYRAIRKGQIKRASQILGADLHHPPRKNDPGGRWLEYSYGWKPLISDMYNILDKGFGDINFVVTGRAKGVRTKRLSYSWTGSGPYHRGSGDTLTLDRASCTAKISIPNTAFAAISSWGLDNPAALAWEALPYSFVVDWFLPVGDYLNDSLNLSGPIKITEMSVTEVTETTLNGSGIFTEDVKVPIANKASGRCQHTRRYKIRTTGIVSRPLPSFNNPFTSLDRFWNQLALFKVEVNRRH